MSANLSAGPPSIKVEPDSWNGQPNQIKSDPDTHTPSPAAQSDDDIYEDAGDLEFSEAAQSIYLSRLPKFLWECWSKLDEDQEISIGRIRMEGAPGDIKRMSLLLDPRLPANENVPKEYNMHIANKQSQNTFVFSEKDLPGYRQFQAENAPMHWLNRKKIEKKRAGAQYRRAIPKQTALRGQVTTELHYQPVENEEYNKITTRQAELSFRPKQKIQLLDDTPGGNLLAPGTIGYAKDYKNFIGKAGPARKKGQTLKTARMPHNELMDLLFECFKEYTYWPFSALKQRVQQPEAYLKEVLEKIAFLSRAGNHMSQWQLKDEVKLDRYGTMDVSKDDVAPDPGPTSSYDAADDFEENIDMEDVPLG